MEQELGEERACGRNEEFRAAALWEASEDGQGQDPGAGPSHGELIGDQECEPYLEELWEAVGLLGEGDERCFRLGGTLLSMRGSAGWKKAETWVRKSFPPSAKSRLQPAPWERPPRKRRGTWMGGEVCRLEQAGCCWQAPRVGRKWAGLEHFAGCRAAAISRHRARGEKGLGEEGDELRSHAPS